MLCIIQYMLNCYDRPTVPTKIMYRETQESTIIPVPQGETVEEIVDKILEDHKRR